MPCRFLLCRGLPRRLCLCNRPAGCFLPRSLQSFGLPSLALRAFRLLAHSASRPALAHDTCRLLARRFATLRFLALALETRRFLPCSFQALRFLSRSTAS